MVVHPLQEHLEGDAVVQIFAGMNLEAQVDAGFFKGIEDWAPAPRQFVESGLNQTCGALRPRIHVGPSQRTGKSGVGAQAEVGRSFGGV